MKTIIKIKKQSCIEEILQKEKKKEKKKDKLKAIKNKKLL